jgi:hypothetical protein
MTTGPRRSLLLTAFCLLSVASLITGIIAKFVLGHDWLWDLRVYQMAVEAFNAGAPVYGEAWGGLRFVYPPLVLQAFALLGPWLTPVFLAGFAAIGALFILYAPVSLRWAMLLYFGVLAFVTEPMILALRTGNLSVFATLGILLLWRLEDRLGQLPLLLTIVLCAAIKPQYAAFLALGPLSGRLDPATWLRAGLGLVAIGAIWAAQAIWAPAAFAAFLASLQAQLGLAGAESDMGYSILAYLHRATGSTLQAAAGHAAFWVAITAAWLLILRRLLRAGTDAETRRALILSGAFLLCLLASPRLKIYDTAVLGLLCVEAGVLWCKARLSRRLWVLPLVGLAAAMAGIRLLLWSETLTPLYRGSQPYSLLAFFGVAALALSRPPPGGQGRTV